MRENSLVDKKSLKVLVGKTADFKELAKDCICFANAQGGETHIGIEDKEDAPYRTDDEVVKSHELFGDTLYKKLTSKKILQSASNKKLKKK
ncbi:MAG: hypothetical protein HOC18_13775 [Candidatus Marinimicrobia bacterium]|jgi:ATP-dependent DNA helicase RecG|nr:hypothetical protein [Candidatus Neomarinimicrobiota bacterium]